VYTFVQPIHEIASILKQYPNCFLHVDCTQGNRKRAFASWRISLNHLVKEEEINKFLKIFDKCYNQ